MNKLEPIVEQNKVSVSIATKLEVRACRDYYDVNMNTHKC